MKSALLSLSRRRLLSGLLAGSLPSLGAVAAQTSRANRASPAARDPLVYAVAQPRTPSAQPPALFLMHGYGADENDLLDVGKSLPPEWLIVSFRAPYANDGGGYRWYDHRTVDGLTDGNPDQLLASEHAVLDGIASVAKQYGIDPHRVFIGGFSQGAVLTYLLALSHPERFRGAVVLSGAILPSELPLLQSQPGFDRRARIPMFVGHGTADTTIPFPLADAASMYLSRWHVPVTFHRYPGMGHAIDSAELADLDAWLAPLSR